MLLCQLQFTISEICYHLVQFNPQGHYFASSSHDRTARIWSMDRIQPLRIMAGHLSDVDVSNFCSFAFLCFILKFIIFNLNI